MRSNETTMGNTWGKPQSERWNNKRQLKQIMTKHKSTVADMVYKRQNADMFYIVCNGL